MKQNKNKINALLQCSTARCIRHWLNISTYHHSDFVRSHKPADDVMYLMFVIWLKTHV